MAWMGSVDPEMLLPVLPALSALLALAMAAVPSAWARGVVVAAVTAYALASLAVSLGPAAWAQRTRQALRPFPLLHTALATDAAEMGPRPDLREWPAEALVDQIARRAS